MDVCIIDDGWGSSGHSVGSTMFLVCLSFSSQTSIAMEFITPWFIHGRCANLSVVDVFDL